MELRSDCGGRGKLDNCGSGAAAAAGLGRHGGRDGRVTCITTSRAEINATNNVEPAQRTANSVRDPFVAAQEYDVCIRAETG
jgi:hypothetical protein